MASRGLVGPGRSLHPRYRESVGGLADAIKAFKALPDESQRLLNTATEDTLIAIWKKARNRVPIRKGQGLFGYQGGALRNAIDYSLSKTTGVGVVGLTRAKMWRSLGKGQGTHNVGSEVVVQGSRRPGKSYTLIQPSKYGHLVEFGSGPRKWKKGKGKSTGAMPAHPFMIPAAESERAAYLDRCRRMGQELERTFDIGAGGVGRQETL